MKFGAGDVARPPLSFAPLIGVSLVDNANLIIALSQLAVVQDVISAIDQANLQVAAFEGGSGNLNAVPVDTFDRRHLTPEPVYFRHGT